MITTNHNRCFHFSLSDKIIKHHSGQVIVADGTKEAAKRLQRVLTADPAMGIFRHVDAGYDAAKKVASSRGVVRHGLPRLV